MSADVQIVATAQLTDGELVAIRRLMDDAFEGDFSDDDWAHALGGWHAVLRDDGAIVAHASVVERHLLVGNRACRAGYVEAVAVMPSRQRQGLGTAVMAALGEIIHARFELGVLSSGEWGFYERLGWERWQGPTYVRLVGGSTVRSPGEDDGVMVLRGATNLDLDSTSAMTCEERAGDSW
jgi:aminoglycoside 2'-N-acetyltransferase I